MLIAKREESDASSDDKADKHLNPQFYCILGHLQLLTENFSKGEKDMIYACCYEILGDVAQGKGFAYLNRLLYDL